MKHEELTKKIIGAYFEVHKALGYGFLEKVYENSLLPIHEAQLLNYLKATDYEVGLLLNFGPSGKVIRKVYDNKSK